jgi:CheY-like chemotaxis protein
MTKSKLTTGILPPCDGEVLVVDDDPALRETAVEVLGMAGFKAAGVSNGAEALGFLAMGRADVVLLDLRMPVLDGWAFLRRRAADPTLTRIPVIVLSGEPLDASIARAVNGWLTKPFDEAGLLDAVATAMANAPKARVPAEDRSPSVARWRR